MKNSSYFQFSNTNYNYFGASRVKTLCLLFFIICSSYSLSAQETTWNGSNNSDWGNAGNWSNGVPTASHHAVIQSSSNDPLIQNIGEITLSHLRIEAGATLTIGEGEIVNIKRFDNFKDSRVENIGLLPTATLINSGRINIEENPSFETVYGIFNNGGTVINNEQSGNLSNSGIIEIRGINAGNLDTEEAGINNVGLFTNHGTILLDDNEYGILCTEATGQFINNGSIDILSADITGIRVEDSGLFTNNGMVNIDDIFGRGIGLGANDALGGSYINSSTGVININQKRSGDIPLNSIEVGTSSDGNSTFENQGGIIRIDYHSLDFLALISVRDSRSFKNTLGGIIYLGSNSLIEADREVIETSGEFFNDRCSGIINRSNREFKFSIFGSPSIGNNGWIISHSAEANRLTHNNLGRIINFGSGAFNIDNGTDIPGNNEPTITQEIFCPGTENIQITNYLRPLNFDYCFDLVLKRLDNGEMNTSGSFAGLLPGQSYDIEISYGDRVVDTFTHSVSSIVDNTPPTLNCIADTLVFDLGDDPNPTVTVNELTTAIPTDADCSVATFEIQGYGASRTFGCDDAGRNTLTVVAIDQAGNTSSCEVYIDITGVYPETNSPDNITLDVDVYLDENGSATLSKSDLTFNVVFTTRCFTQLQAEENYSIPVAYQNFGCDNIGTTTFSLNSADSNFPDVNQTITVIDSTPIRAFVADVTVILDASGVGTLDKSDLMFTVSDNCFTDAQIIAAYSVPSEFRTFDCTQVGTHFVTLDKSNNDFPQVIIQVTVVSMELSFDPIVTDFCASTNFDLTSLEDQITTANGTFTYSKAVERLYIPNENDNNVSVIDLMSNTVIKTIDVGAEPTGVAVHPNGKKVYVTNAAGSSVSVIDVASNTVETTINVGSFPLGTAFNAGGSRLYVTNFTSDNISVINTGTNTVVNTISTGNTPWGIALSPDDSKIYVANHTDNEVGVINANTGATITTIAVQNKPFDIALSADNTKLYVANLSGLGANNTKGAIDIIDISTDAIEETIFTFISATNTNYQDAYDFAVQPTGNLYTSHLSTQGGSISRLEPNNGNATSYYNIEDGISNDIQAISLNEDGSTLYMVDELTDKVIFFNTATNTEGISIAVGDVGRCVGEFYVKTTIDIADPTSYIPSQNDVIGVAFDGGAACESTTTITFNATLTPDVTASTDRTYCSGDATTPIAFSGNVAGTLFSWTNTNTNIGLPASGTGDITSFTATNPTTDTISATVTITPYSVGANCVDDGGTGDDRVGTPQTFTISILPTPTVTDPVDVTYITGESTTEISFSGNVANTLFTWTNDNTSIGLAASGKGNISSFIATNAIENAISATITVTPYTVGANGIDDNGTADDCVGISQTFTITVGVLATCTANDLSYTNPIMEEGTFHAGATISSQSTIESNTTVVYKAGTSITLGVGFHAEANSSFTATIEACAATLVESETRSTQSKVKKTEVRPPNVKVFPNPVRSYTNISINLPEEQEVQMDIFDMNGRKIATIVQPTPLFAGTHTFEWSCDQVRAGIYFVVMNGRQVGRLAVMR